MTLAFTFGNPWRWGIEPAGTMGAGPGFVWCWAFHFGGVTLAVTKWDFAKNR